MSYYFLNEYKKSIKDLKSGLENKKIGKYAKYIALLFLGFNNNELNFYTDEALNYANKAIDLSINDFYGYELRGMIYTEKEKYSDALNDYNKIIELYPKKIEGYLGLASLYFYQEKYDKSINELNKIIEQFSNNEDIYIGLSQCYEKLGNISKAENILLETIKIAPIEISSALALLYAEQNIKLDKAEILIKECLIEEPNNPKFIDTYGWVLYKQSKYNKALEIFYSTKNLGDKSFELKKHIGKCHLKLNNISKAKEYF